MGCNDLIVNNMSSKQFERTRYFSRQLITADDLTQDQDYYREKRRMHNRLLHGWGIVCGLKVEEKTNTATSLIVTICPGYALSPQGDEIYVPTEVQFDLSQCIKGQDSPCHSPCAPVVPYAVDPLQPFYIAIKYAQCMSHPVRVPPLGCGCDDTACEYSRTRDSYELTCLPTPPTRDTGHCTECPTNPWVVLASVEIEESGVQIDISSTSGRSIFLKVGCAALLNQITTLRTQLEELTAERNADTDHHHYPYYTAQIARLNNEINRLTTQARQAGCI